MSFILAEVSFESDKSPRKKIQILKTGKFFDPRYGEFEFNPEHLLKLKENFETKVRKIDIALDFGHESEDKAAAWFKNLTIEDSGTTLFAEIDWTPVGEKSVTDKEFRYISPDIRPNYEDNETRKKHGPVLMGAALTNRPVIKGMQAAIELKEQKNSQGENTMSDLQTEHTKLIDNFANLKAENLKLSEANDKNTRVLQETNMTPEQMMAKIAELESQLKAEKDKSLAAHADKQLSEKTAKFDALVEKGEACPAQKEAYLADNMDEYIKQAGNVNLSEGGTAGTVVVKQKPGADKKGDEAVDEVMKLADEKMKVDGNTKDLGENISLVLSENPKLKTEYEASNNVQAVATAE